jgi:cytochrome c oxidase cbb3-type subunit 3
VNQTTDAADAAIERYGDSAVAARAVPRPLALAVALTASFAALYWLWAIAFAVVPGPLDRYAAERSAALETGALVSDAMLEELAADPLAVRTGERLFATSCGRCHGPGGEGGVGPNLTDDHWIGDGSAIAIYTTIVAGRARAGMPAWGAELGRGACKQLTAFVVSRRGLALPGKPPQGTRWVRPAGVR